MRKLLLTIAISMLSGCAVVDAYLMTKYDPNEYRLITEIRAEAQGYKTQCDNTETSKINAVKMMNKTNLFMMYSEQIPRNSNGINASKELNEMAKGLDARYGSGEKVSSTFCRIKFESIEHSAQTIQHVIGNRPR